MKLYTCEAVADWLALTPRRVRQLRDEGILSERMPGLYEMKPTILRYILYLRKGRSGGYGERFAAGGTAQLGGN